jgi:outer membrane protein
VQETCKATEEHLRQAKALMAGGLGTKVDILRWQAKIADDEQKLLEAQQQVASAKMRLNNLLGRPLRAVVTVIPPAEVTAAELPRPQAVSAPLRSHPQLRLTRLNVKMTRIGEQTAKAAFLPTVTLSGGYSWQNYMPYEDFASKTWLGSWAVMLSVKVPIFDSMTKFYNVQLKQLEVAKARMQYRNVRRLLTEAVLQADLAVNRSYRSIEVAKKQVKLAAEAHKSAENLYQAGSAKTTDVLDAQNGLRLARFNLLSARFGYLTALVQRDKAIGNIK